MPPEARMYSGANRFRKERLYTSDVEDVLFAHKDVLRAAFELYKAGAKRLSLDQVDLYTPLTHLLRTCCGDTDHPPTRAGSFSSLRTSYAQLTHAYAQLTHMVAG
eukprot:5589199-Pyramimonas_sp.AAC.1